jgi:hypothetical protein
VPIGRSPANRPVPQGPVQGGSRSRVEGRDHSGDDDSVTFG